MNPNLNLYNMSVPHWGYPRKEESLNLLSLRKGLGALPSCSRGVKRRGLFSRLSLCDIADLGPPKRIPKIITDLHKEIQESEEWILSLKDNWDDEGSRGYKSITYMRSKEFLHELYMNLIHEDNLEIPIPEILPGPHGSIDIHWKTEKLELIVNIPDDDKAVASFYGDNYGDLSIKGTFSLYHFYPVFKNCLMMINEL